MTIKREHHLSSRVWFFSLCGFTAVWASFSFSRTLLQGKWCCIYNRQAASEWEREGSRALVKRIDFLMAQNAPTHRIRSQIISLASALYWDCARAVSHRAAALVAALRFIYLSLLYASERGCGKSALLRASLLWCAGGLKLIYQTELPPLARLLFISSGAHQLTSVLQEREIFNTILRRKSHLRLKFIYHAPQSLAFVLTFYGCYFWGKK